MDAHRARRGAERRGSARASARRGDARPDARRGATLPHAWSAPRRRASLRASTPARRARIGRAHVLLALAKGPPTAEMRDVLAMTDALVAELPRMVEEHVRIGAAARKLEAVAREERNRKVEALAKKLQLHAKTEEEVFYPAAVVVGKMVKGQG